jgi:hypothetical protein
MDYEGIAEQAVLKFIALAGQREAIDLELAKVSQFLFATLHLLSDEAAIRFTQKWGSYMDQIQASTTSLTDSVRKVLRGCYPKKFTASQVLHQMRVEGFDFSSYKSDPLPSVSTTLRRLKDSKEIIGDEFEGVAVYSAKPQKAMERTDSAFQRFKQAHDARYPRGRTVSPPPGSPGETLPTQDDLAHEKEKEYEGPRLGYLNPTNTQKGKK